MIAEKNCRHWLVSAAPTSSRLALLVGGWAENDVFPRDFQNVCEPRNDLKIIRAGTVLVLGNGRLVTSDLLGYLRLGKPQAFSGGF